MAILGIDLGTSNSAAAVAVQGEIKMIEPAEGGTDEGMVFPSYVSFDVNGNVSNVGTAAKRQFPSAADLIVRHAKRLIGRSYDYLHRESQNAEETGQKRRFLDEFSERIERGDTGEVLIRVGKTGANKYTPQEMAKFILEKIRDDAEPQVRQLLGVGIDGAVITVPAGFDDAPLRATLWAGEQVFGVGRVQLINEPLAAAIASEIRGDQETIMVVDMGAGTTDIVVGNVLRTAEGPKWIPVTQNCDDELGGWDMDCQILEHLLRTDQKEPYLRQFYPHLDLRNQGRLMEAIERTKIAISSAGVGQVSVVLEAMIDGNSVRKALTQTLDAKAIKSIVAYKGNKFYGDKGSVVERCRALVEGTLLQLADNNPDHIDEVKQSLDRVILVGGPMRMRCLYDMMTEMFASKLQVLQPFDPLSPFPVECVAKGAALFQGGKVTLQVPHTLSLYDWGKKGRVQMISRGVPYEGEAMASTKIEVDEGTTWLDVITEKENLSVANYPVREHIVRVPQRGLLEVTLRWDTAGCRIAFNGLGLSATEIPPVSDQTTLVEDFERQFRIFFVRAKNLRMQLLDPEVRQRVNEMVMGDFKKNAPQDLQSLVNADASLDDAKGKGQTMKQRLDERVTQLLHVPEDDLRKCDGLDPDYLSKLQESEIQLMLEKGYEEAAKERILARGVSERVYEAVVLLRRFSVERISVDELIKTTGILLEIVARGSMDLRFQKDLQQFFEQLRIEPNNRFLIANVSVRMAALADVLHDQGLISRDALRQAKKVAAHAKA
ncbi:MAG: Hsp70 family protein [Armatimonadota bacterium]